MLRRVATAFEWTPADRREFVAWARRSAQGAGTCTRAAAGGDAVSYGDTLDRQKKNYRNRPVTN